MAGAESGSMEEVARSEGQDTTRDAEAFEERPTAQYERVEQYPEGEDPVAYFRDRAGEAQQRMKSLDSDPMNKERFYGDGGEEAMARVEQDIKEELAQQSADIKVALKEARLNNRMASAIEDGNDPAALDKAHDILLQELVSIEEQEREQAEKVQELYQKAEAAGADPRVDAPKDLGDIEHYVKDGDMKNTMFPIDRSARGGYEVYKLNEARQKLDDIQQEKAQMENMAGHVKSIIDRTKGN